MDNQYDFWFKLRCYYNAKTELYDRILTDKRSPYDNTEAWLPDRHSKTLSNQFAVPLRNYCKDIALRCKEIASIELFEKYFNEPDKQCHLSAQGWIDMYNHLVEIGEMDFIDA